MKIHKIHNSQKFHKIHKEELRYFTFTLDYY